MLCSRTNENSPESPLDFINGWKKVDWSNPKIYKDSNFFGNPQKARPYSGSIFTGPSAPESNPDQASSTNAGDASDPTKQNIFANIPQQTAANDKINSESVVSATEDSALQPQKSSVLNSRAKGRGLINLNYVPTGPAWTIPIKKRSEEEEEALTRQRELAEKHKPKKSSKLAMETVMSPIQSIHGSAKSKKLLEIQADIVEEYLGANYEFDEFEFDPEVVEAIMRVPEHEFKKQSFQSMMDDYEKAQRALVNRRNEERERS